MLVYDVWMFADFAEQNVIFIIALCRPIRASVVYICCRTVVGRCEMRSGARVLLGFQRMQYDDWRQGSWYTVTFMRCCFVDCGFELETGFPRSFLNLQSVYMETLNCLSPDFDTDLHNELTH